MEIIGWLFPILLAFIGIWMFLPRALQFFLKDSQKIYFEEAASSIFRGKSAAEAERITGDLESLGFIKLGVRAHKLPLWSTPNKELVFASEKEGSFATIFFIRNKVTYSFYTPFTGGQSVLTTYKAFRDMSDDSTIIANYKEDKPHSILEKHRENVEIFRSKGLTPISHYTRESRLEVSRTFYSSPQARSSIRKMSAFYVILVIVCLIPLVLLLSSLRG